MLRRILATLTIAAGVMTPVPGHAAATHVVELREGGRAFYIAPASVVVAPGDTVVVRNLSTVKNATWTDPDGSGSLTTGWAGATAIQTPPGTASAATSFPPGTEVSFTVPTGFNASTGSFSGGTPAASATPLLLTTTPPSFPPQAPVLSSPEPDSIIAGAPNGTNPVTFAGTAVNAKNFRVEIRNLSGNERQWDREYFGLVDGDAAWSTTVNVANGVYRVQAFSRHWQGFEAAGAPFFIEVDGNDIAAPFMDCGASMNGCVKRGPDRGFFLGSDGNVDITGVVVDDTVAKSIEVTVQGPTPFYKGSSPQKIHLTCFIEGSNGTPDEPTSCDSASNPSRLKFRGRFMMQWQGSYSFVFTARDAAGKSQTFTKSVSMDRPI